MGAELGMEEGRDPLVQRVRNPQLPSGCLPERSPLHLPSCGLLLCPLGLTAAEEIGPDSGLGSGVTGQ